MKNYAYIIIISIIFSLNCFAGDSYELKTEEVSLIRKINDARQDPLRTAEKLGMDSQKLLKELPWLKEILVNGLPPLKISSNLIESSKICARDIVGNKFFGYPPAPSNGFMIKNRILSTGYIPVICDEILGVVSFNNYISPILAVDLIFEHMFRDEIENSKMKGYKNKILSPEFSEVGVSILPKQFYQTKQLQNMYIAVCDIAVRDTSRDWYMSLWQMINEARYNPMEAYNEIGFDKEYIDNLYGDESWKLEFVFPPFAWNEQLRKSAQLINKEIIGKWKNNDLPGEDIEKYRQDFKAVREFFTDQEYSEVKLICQTYMFDQGERLFSVIQRFYTDMLRKETSAFDFFLNRNFSEIGLSIDECIIEVEKDNYKVGYLITALLAKPAENRYYIIGSIDLNMEEIKDIDVSDLEIAIVNGDSDEVTARPNELGMFQIQKPDGFIVLEIRNKDLVLYRNLLISYGYNLSYHIKLSVDKPVESGNY